MTVADDVLNLVKRKPRLRLTAIDITEMLYGQDNAYQQRVNADCVLLCDQGKLVRNGRGGPSDPYTYSIPPIKRRI